MDLSQEPKKSKAGFIVVLILAIVFFITSCVLGYFYYSASKKIAHISDLEKQVDSLTKEKDGLEKQVADYQAKSTKLAAYVECLNYLDTLVETHQGLDGWTEAEYQTGRDKIQATGDQALVDKADWAWNTKSVDQTTRLLGFLQVLIQGMKSNL
jgi:cell division protein FtsB